MTYKALTYFEDLQDNRFKYHTGDVYPRVGFEPSEKRISELLSANNKRGCAVIEAVKAVEEVSNKTDIMNPPVVEQEFEQIVLLPEESVKPKRGRRRKEKN